MIGFRHPMAIVNVCRTRGPADFAFQVTVPGGPQAAINEETIEEQAFDPLMVFYNLPLWARVHRSL
jgi:hypothetical protein